MKTKTQKMLQKNKTRREFIDKFKTQVKDSSSIQNLRISKIDESCYKIYNTHITSPTQINSNRKSSKSNKAYFSCNPHSQMNQLETERKVTFAANYDYFSKQNRSYQIQNDNGWQAKSKYLQQVLRRRLEDFYHLIRARVVEVQNLCVLNEHRKSEVNKLEQLNNVITIADSIFKNTSKLKSLCGFPQQAYNINLIIKALIQKVEDYDQTDQTHTQPYPPNFDRLKKDLDEANAGLGQEMLSVSSFKIENQKTHQQQFLNAYLSSNNSKVDLNYNPKAESCIKGECEDRAISKYQNPPIKYTIEIIRPTQQKTHSNKATTTNSKYFSKQIQSTKQEQVVCQLLRCNEVQRQPQIEKSETKRRALNEMIVMLNTKYNRCVKFQ